MTLETSDNAPLTQNEAAEKLSSLLKPKEKPVKEQISQETEADSETVTDEAEDENTEQTFDGEDPDGESHSEDDDEVVDEEGEEEPEKTFKVKVDGQEIEVNERELKDGYMRQSDYSRKMGAIAKERKELETIKEQTKDLPIVQKRYAEGAERFTQNAQLVLAAFEKGFMPKEPDIELVKTDPVAYHRQKEARQEALQFIAGLQHEFGQLKAENKAEFEKTINESRGKLMMMQPELKEQANRARLVEYAKTHGFSDEQISNETNPILFQWAWKALQFDELMSKKPKPESFKPKVMKQGKAPEPHKAVAQRKIGDALNVHKQNGSIQSAAAALSALKAKR